MCCGYVGSAIVTGLFGLLRLLLCSGLLGVPCCCYWFGSVVECHVLDPFPVSVDLIVLAASGGGKCGTRQ